TSRPECRARVWEPTGSPSRMWRPIRVLRSWRARGSSSCPAPFRVLLLMPHDIRARRAMHKRPGATGLAAGRPALHNHACLLPRLSIRDFAVASATEIAFGPGLTVISGETGAGKSLLVDALGFLSGQRADSGMVRHGATRAELHAEFDLAASDDARQWLREEEFDDGDACQLRRTLRADGGSRAWINGRPATLSQLAALAARLVEIHGQHEHQALLSRPSQLVLLDAFGGHARLLDAVSGAAQRWSTLLRERDTLTRAREGRPG